jgi:hypothetical protein
MLKIALNVWTVFMWLRIWSSSGSLEHGIEPWGYIKGWESPVLGILMKFNLHGYGRSLAHINCDVRSEVFSENSYCDPLGFDIVL